jgi:hypothetical protein
MLYCFATNATNWLCLYCFAQQQTTRSENIIARMSYSVYKNNVKSIDRRVDLTLQYFLVEHADEVIIIYSTPIREELGWKGGKTRHISRWNGARSFHIVRGIKMLSNSCRLVSARTFAAESRCQTQSHPFHHVSYK